MPNITRAFIVTDPEWAVSLGYVDKILYYLRRERIAAIVIVKFSDVEPDLSIETVKRGAQMMDLKFKPDLQLSHSGGEQCNGRRKGYVAVL